MQSASLPIPAMRKLPLWLYGLLILLITAGLLYVLLAPRANPDASTADRTPLGGAAIALIQDTLRATSASPAFGPLALGAAFLLGALHALTPGHNKTLTGTYLVSASARLSHAFLIGGATAFSHTASATVLGILAVTTAGQIASTEYLRWIGLVSGGLSVFLGLWLLRKHLRAGRAQSHESNHGHSHDHDHTHGGDDEHSHPPLGPDRLTLGGFVALGLSHGIVPTFDAMAVLLVALSVKQVLLGVGLVLAYSLGLAGVLVAVGVLFVHTQKMLMDRPRWAVFSRRAPVLSAGVVILLGLVLIARTVIALAG